MIQSSKIAFLFPGQGSQYVGMGKDFFSSFAIVRETFEEASDILSWDMKKLILEGPEITLQKTKYSQPAIFVLSCATYRLIQQQLPNIVPSVCAGLSLGEYSALYACNKLSFAETLSIVANRGEWMTEASGQHQGVMSAIIGLEAFQVDEIIHSLQPEYQIWVANYNTPHQTVISGQIEAVALAEEQFKKMQAKRVMRLKVEGAFHSPLMQYAKEKLADMMLTVSFQKSSIDLVMNVPGDYVQDLDDIKKYLIEQVTSSVLWQKGIEKMEKHNICAYVEIGCGKTLTNMNKKIGVNAASYYLDKVQDLDKLSELSCNY